MQMVQSKSPEEIAISAITLAELEYGVIHSRDRERNRAAAVEYGQLRPLVEAGKNPIGPVDLLLAAQAKSRGLILVTNNEREFKRVEGLRVENWAKGTT
jgi:tRNA(fMet)-specific endonuclease VapC